MKSIKCKCGKEILLDDVQFEVQKDYNWLCDGKRVYRITHTEPPERKTVIVTLSGTIKPARAGYVTDHINRDFHDNQEHNLREATNSESVHNRNKMKSNTSGFIGVSFVCHSKKKGERWRAYVWNESVMHHVGYYRSAEEAAKARDKKAKELHGAFAVLNFP